MSEATMIFLVLLHVEADRQQNNMLPIHPTIHLIIIELKLELHGCLFSRNKSLHLACDWLKTHTNNRKICESLQCHNYVV